MSASAAADSVVNIENLWKAYGDTIAVRGLSLSVPPRSVYGFLGPNGAGKSTTIRMILGLQRPDRGEIRLFGNSHKPGRTAVLARVGSLVESPSLYPHLTGRENLEVYRRLLDLPKRAIDESLDTVRLTSAADRVVRGYSSGMKQRLGLAQALLGKPELLLLDEPTNGLDPAGIHEVRSLIRELPARRGVTLFLSSHLLAEVEQVATHFAIIASGELMFEGRAEDLRVGSKPVIVAEVDDAERALELFARSEISATREGVRTLRIEQSEYGPEIVNAMLVRAGIAVYGLAVRRPNLEEAFLEMTGAAAPEKDLVFSHDA